MADQKKESSGSGTETVYYVEARSTYVRPESIHGQLFDQRWSRVEWAKHGEVGVQNNVYSAEAVRCGYLTYEAALTLAHWFLTNAPHSYCLQARLVQVEFKYSFTSEEIGVSAPISHPINGPDDAFKARLPAPTGDE